MLEKDHGEILSRKRRVRERGTVIYINTNMNLDTGCHNSTVCGRHQVVEVTQLLNQYLLDNMPQETHRSCSKNAPYAFAAGCPHSVISQTLLSQKWNGMSLRTVAMEELHAYLAWPCARLPISTRSELKRIASLWAAY